jgi:hypothetical protein
MPTNFLEAPGTSGFIATPFNLMTTELNALAINGSATSSVGGAAGVFTQTNYANAVWAQIYATFTTTFTPLAGGYLAGWFLFSPDGGTTFETTAAGVDLARQPDFTIPFNAAATGATFTIAAFGITRVAWWSNKLFVTNRLGVALPATGNIIKAAPVAIQY